MKEKKFKIAEGLRNNILRKKRNLKDAAEFMAGMEKREEILISPVGGYRDPSFHVPVRLAQGSVEIMVKMLALELKAAEEVFKRL